MVCWSIPFDPGAIRACLCLSIYCWSYLLNCAQAYSYNSSWQFHRISSTVYAKQCKTMPLHAHVAIRDDMVKTKIGLNVEWKSCYFVVGSRFSFNRLFTPHKTSLISDFREGDFFSRSLLCCIHWMNSVRLNFETFGFSSKMILTPNSIIQEIFFSLLSNRNIGANEKFQSCKCDYYNGSICCAWLRLKWFFVCPSPLKKCLIRRCWWCDFGDFF